MKMKEFGQNQKKVQCKKNSSPQNHKRVWVVKFSKYCNLPPPTIRYRRVLRSAVKTVKIAGGSKILISIPAYKWDFTVFPKKITGQATKNYSEIILYNFNQLQYFLERAPGHSFKSQPSRGGTDQRKFIIQAGRSFKNL